MAPALTPQQQTAADVTGYVRDFRSLGGNLLIAHGLITPDKAFYPSQICRTDVEREGAGAGALARGSGVPHHRGTAVAQDW